MELPTFWQRKFELAEVAVPLSYGLGNKKQGSWLIDMPLLRLQIMKYQQLSKKARGDGAVTCRVCNYDFTNQRSRRPTQMVFCQECGKVWILRQRQTPMS